MTTTTITVDSDRHIAKEYLGEFFALCRANGIEVTVDAEDGTEFAEIDAEASGHCTPFRRGVHTLSNGDPGWPDEPAMCEDLEVKVFKTEITAWLTDSAVEEFEEKVLERADDDARGDYDY